MANAHGLGNHPVVVIIGVISAMITLWSFVTEKPPYISAFGSFLEEVIKSLPSEKQKIEGEANYAHQQAEQTHSQEAQRKAQEQTRRFEQQAAEAQRKDREQTRGLTRRREQQEAEAQRKAQEQKALAPPPTISTHRRSNMTLCRAFTAKSVLDGQAINGTVCRQPDGSWVEVVPP